MKYEILEHPADLKIRAFGKTKEEVFLNIMRGMTENLRPAAERHGEIINQKFKVESPDLSALLVDFLSQILYFIQTQKIAYNNIKFDKFSDTEIEGEVEGKKVRGLGEDIKAVTHYDVLFVQKEDET
ncbi:MAG: archease [Parcubacteria group bacterium]